MPKQRPLEVRIQETEHKLKVLKQLKRLEQERENLRAMRPPRRRPRKGSTGP